MIYQVYMADHLSLLDMQGPQNRYSTKRMADGFFWERTRYGGFASMGKLSSTGASCDEQKTQVRYIHKKEDPDWVTM